MSVESGDLKRQFHLAVSVTDLDATKKFYSKVLGCKQGAESEGYWVDFDWYGTQLSFHLDPNKKTNYATGKVDGAGVPIPHFGAILEKDEWIELEDRLTKLGVEFFKEAHLRYKGLPREQRTMFLKDPSGNIIEIKGFTNMDQIFDPGTPKPN